MARLRADVASERHRVRQEICQKRCSAMRIRILALSALFTLVPLFSATNASAAEASGAPDANYCEHFVETGKQVCFQTLSEAKSYESAAALAPLVTVFRDINFKGGYYNFVSAYGRATCTPAENPHESSSGDLRNLTWSTGGSLYETISSVVINATSGCKVTLYSKFGFDKNSAWVEISGGNHQCADLDACILLDNWNDRAASLSVS